LILFISLIHETDAEIWTICNIDHPSKKVKSLSCFALLPCVKDCGHLCRRFTTQNQQFTSVLLWLLTAWKSNMARLLLHYDVAAIGASILTMAEDTRMTTYQQQQMLPSIPFLSASTSQCTLYTSRQCCTQTFSPLSRKSLAPRSHSSMRSDRWLKARTTFT
jgi:hypothetical protein